MNAIGMWRVGEQRGDRVLALVLLLVSAVVALAMASERSLESIGTSSLQERMTFFPMLLFLAIRYTFGSGRIWMLAVDAARAQLPGLPARVLRIEALRAAHFVLLPALPFVFAGALPVAASIFAAMLAGISIGILYNITPYRYLIVPGVGLLALVIIDQYGLLAWLPLGSLLVATVLSAFTVLCLRWRIATMTRAPADAAEGMDRSWAEAIGRHTGSIWTAPDFWTAPEFTSLSAMMLKAGRRNTTPQSPVVLLGESVAGRLASPGRDLWGWVLRLVLVPVVMTGFFSLPGLDVPTLPAIQTAFGMVWPVVVLIWVPYAAVAFLWVHTFRPVRIQLRADHPVREALHLLPGMPTGPAAWRRRLQRLTWAPITVGGLVLMSTLPWVPEGAMRAIHVVVVLLMAGLLWMQPAVAVSRSSALPARAAVAAALSALLLLILYLQADINLF